MKMSNKQIKLLIPVVLREARDHPNIEWDVLINRLIELASFRGERKFLMELGLLAEDSQTTETKDLERPAPATSRPEHTAKSAKHPLL